MFGLVVLGLVAYVFGVLSGSHLLDLASNCVIYHIPVTEFVWFGVLGVVVFGLLGEVRIGEPCEFGQVRMVVFGLLGEVRISGFGWFGMVWWVWSGTYVWVVLCVRVCARGYA